MIRMSVDLRRDDNGEIVRRNSRNNSSIHDSRIALLIKPSEFF